MSITFFCPDAPYTINHVPAEDIGGQIFEGYDERVSSVPEVNFSNDAAYSFMEMIGIEKDENGGGEIEAKILSDFRQKIMVLLNTHNYQQFIVTPSMSQRTRVEHEGNISRLCRGASFYDCGMGEDRIRRGLERLNCLFEAAQKGGYSVSFG